MSMMHGANEIHVFFVCQYEKYITAAQTRYMAARLVSAKPLALICYVAVGASNTKRGQWRDRHTVRIKKRGHSSSLVPWRVWVMYAMLLFWNILRSIMTTLKCRKLRRILIGKRVNCPPLLRYGFVWRNITHCGRLYYN